jgi:hypothetical protein
LGADSYYGVLSRKSTGAKRGTRRVRRDDEELQMTRNKQLQEQELADFPKIIARIKVLMLREQGKATGHIKDVEVARELGILPSTFRSKKKLESIPYEKILKWCSEIGQDATYIFKP